MKTHRFIFILASSFLLGCEKVIDVSLDNDKPRLVIEANLIEGEHLFMVTISQTADYFDDSAPTYISTADVYLRDQGGNEILIPFVEDGRYEAMVTAEVGINYILTVELDGVVYEAQSFLPEKVPLVELIPEEERATPAFDEGYSLFIRFDDPIAEENYYRFIFSIDGERQLNGEDMQVLDDNLFDGGEARIRLFAQVFDPGDTVEVELVHFDQSSYEYFNSLSDIIGDGQGPNAGNAAPGNPVSNWSGDILGYFSAYSADTLSIVIRD